MDNDFPQQDDLEEYFRLGFYNLENNPAAAWCTPSNKIWDEIAASFSKKASFQDLKYLQNVILFTQQNES